MKQVLASLKTGEARIHEVPVPALKPGHLLISTHTSLISKGTEKMLVDFGKSSLLAKARQQPERVRMILDKVRADGVWPTLKALRHKLDQLLPMGYCNVGQVLQVGPNVEGFQVGDRVVSNGSHAEIVMVAKNLCAKVPSTVTDEEAAFTILGAIALQGIRLAAPQLGECFVVMGLGLVGLLTIQLLQANGCEVLGIDIDPAKVELAKALGAQAFLPSAADLILMAKEFANEQGVDGVLITASTKSNEPVHLAAQLCRQRGRIVLVGVTGLKLSRADFYAKELSFQVSCSYGPGRYDPLYEIAGHDYPMGYVRFTEQRNFAAFLTLLANKKMHVAPLISHRFAIHDVKAAYHCLENEENSLGILLSYPHATKNVSSLQTLSLNANAYASKETDIHIGLLGSGNYASRTLAPLLKKAGAKLHTVACSRGISGMQLGTKYQCQKITTDTETIFSDHTINAVIIATRHDTHASFIQKAILANKHIFVEKPLCLTLSELENLKEVCQSFNKTLMIGFNRRFAPHIQQIKALLAQESQPKYMLMTINAGEIPKDHWTQQREEGGGRIIGEACHFVDLLYFLAAAEISSFTVRALKKTTDNVVITLSFADGSLGTIHYIANGHRRVPKERLEIFTNGKVLQLNNFRQLKGWGWPQFKTCNLWRQDKGQANCLQQFIKAIKEGKPAPIPLAEIFAVNRLTIEIASAI